MGPQSQGERKWRLGKTKRHVLSRWEGAQVVKMFDFARRVFGEETFFESVIRGIQIKRYSLLSSRYVFEEEVKRQRSSQYKLTTVLGSPTPVLGR